MAADCRRELGSWNTGLVGQPPSPCSGELPESADEAHTSHLFSRPVQHQPEGVHFKKAGASRGADGTAHPNWLSRTVKRARQTILARGDGGFTSLHRIGGGNGRRRGRQVPCTLGPGIIGTSMGCRSVCPACRTPGSLLRKKQDHQGWMEGSRPGCTLYRPLTPHSGEDENTTLHCSQYLFLICSQHFTVHRPWRRVCRERERDVRAPRAGLKQKTADLAAGGCNGVSRG
jgi:hypothetical protein